MTRGNCCCSCPVIFDAIWEANRSRWVLVCLITWALHQTYVDILLTQTLNWPTCAEAYRLHDSTAKIPELDDSTVAATRGLLLILGVITTLLSVSTFNSKYWLVLAFPVLTAAIVFEAVQQTSYCFKLSALDEEGIINGESRMTVALEGLGIYVPVALISAYRIMLWLLFIIVDMFLLKALYKHVLRSWCAKPGASNQEDASVTVSLTSGAAVRYGTNLPTHRRHQSIDNSFPTPMVGVAEVQPGIQEGIMASAGVSGEEGIADPDEALMAVETDLLSRVPHDYSRYDGIAGWNFNPSFSGIAGALNAANAAADAEVDEVPAGAHHRRHRSRQVSLFRSPSLFRSDSQNRSTFASDSVLRRGSLRLEGGLGPGDVGKGLEGEGGLGSGGGDGVAAMPEWKAVPLLHSSGRHMPEARLLSTIRQMSQPSLAAISEEGVEEESPQTHDAPAHKDTVLPGLQALMDARQHAVAHSSPIKPVNVVPEIRRTSSIGCCLALNHLYLTFLSFCDFLYIRTKAFIEILHTVPLRVTLGVTISFVFVVELTAALIVVAIMFMPIVEDFVRRIADRYDNPPDGLHEVVMRVSGGGPPSSHMLAVGRLVFALSPNGPGLHNSSLGGMGAQPGNATNTVSNLLNLLLEVPDLLEQSIIIGAIFAFIACLLVFLVTVTVYYGLHLEFWAQEREKDDIVNAELELSERLRVPSLKNLVRAASDPSMVTGITDDEADLLRQSIGYVPARLERLNPFGRMSVRLARAVEGQVFDRIRPVEVTSVQINQPHHRISQSLPSPRVDSSRVTGALSAAAEVPHAAMQKSHSAFVAADTEVLNAVMAHARSTTTIDAIEEAPSPIKSEWITRQPISGCQRCSARCSKTAGCGVAYIKRAFFGKPSAPMLGPGGLPLNRFSFSGAFSFIPFYIINVLLTFVQVFLFSFAVSFLLALPFVREYMITLLSAALISTFLPLILRYVLFGWILADNVRIKHKKLFMLVDTFFAFTVGAVFGTAQAVLRMALVIVWSVMRATQLHAQLVPRLLVGVDPGFTTHGSVLKCKYAAGPPEFDAGCF